MKDLVPTTQTKELPEDVTRIIFSFLEWNNSNYCENCGHSLLQSALTKLKLEVFLDYRNRYSYYLSNGKSKNWCVNCRRKKRWVVLFKENELVDQVEKNWIPWLQREKAIWNRAQLKTLFSKGYPENRKVFK